LIRAPQFLTPAKQLLKDEVYIHQLKVNVKQAFSGEMWPWHQDYIYWRNEDNIPTANIVSVMIFLDDIDEFNGPLFFIPGSHLIGCVDTPKAPDAPAGWEGNVSASLTYQIDAPLVTKLVERGGLFSATGKKGPRFGSTEILCMLPRQTFHRETAELRFSPTTQSAIHLSRSLKISDQNSSTDATTAPLWL